jgi:hypothetical protein
LASCEDRRRWVQGYPFAARVAVMRVTQDAWMAAKTSASGVMVPGAEAGTTAVMERMSRLTLAFAESDLPLAARTNRQSAPATK